MFRRGEDFENGIHWMLTLKGIVTRDSLKRATELPVVDFEYMTAFTGSPFEPGVWVIVETEAERLALRVLQAEITKRVIRLLADGGYPADAAATAIVTVSSREQMRKYRSRDDFFR